MKRITVVIVSVAVLCAGCLAFVLFYPAVSEAKAGSILIDEAPVALGAETSAESTVQIICEGQGNVEVSPYKSGYVQYETLTLTALPADGWVFEGWSGDVDSSLSSSTIKVKIPAGTYNVTAIFIEE